MAWLYLPPDIISSSSALASEASGSESKSPDPERAQSVTWRGSSMQPRHLRLAWKRASWLRRLSGMMLDHSMAEGFVDSWIASLREIRASQIALPESAPGPAMIDGSSINCLGWSMSAGLIVSSARTWRGMRTGSSPLSSQHWKEWAIALRREYSARPKLAPAISASDFSSWQTPATDSFRSRGGDRKDEQGLDQQARSTSWQTPRAARGEWTQDNGDPEKRRASLEGEASNWPTPMAGAAARNGNNIAGNSDFSRKAMKLAEQMGPQWVTPNVPNGGRAPANVRIRGRSGYREDGSKAQIDLQHQVKVWPTPDAAVSNEGESPATFDQRKAKHKARRINGNGMGDTLSIAAQRQEWPTPAARDHKGANSAEHVTTNGTGRMHMDQLPNFVAHSFSPPGQPIAPGHSFLRPIPFSPLPSASSTSGPRLAEISALRRWAIRSGGAAGWQGTWTRSPRRKLNPRFVELLMGWPIGWTASAPVATAFSHWLLQSRGYLSSLSSASPADQMKLL